MFRLKIHQKEIFQIRTRFQLEELFQVNDNNVKTSKSLFIGKCKGRNTFRKLGPQKAETNTNGCTSATPEKHMKIHKNYRNQRPKIRKKFKKSPKDKDKRHKLCD